jgi:hypothetical protein
VKAVAKVTSWAKADIGLGTGTGTVSRKHGGTIGVYPQGSVPKQFYGFVEL